MLLIFLTLKFIHIECSSVNGNKIIVESEQSNSRVNRNDNIQLEGPHKTQLKDLNFLLENPYYSNPSTDYVEHLALIYKNFEAYKKLCNFTYNFRANYLATLNFTSTTPLIEKNFTNITSNTSIVDDTLQQNTLKRNHPSLTLDNENDQSENRFIKLGSHENEVMSDNTDDIFELKNTTEDTTVPIIKNYNSLQFFNKPDDKYQLCFFFWKSSLKHFLF
ncbi:hypothetical protein GVAV_001565 [Gurleya vavrai]